MKRPLAVTSLAWVYIAVGVVGFGYNLTLFHTRDAFQLDNILVELVRFVAIVAGVFMLRGNNWARWLAVAWIAAHVVLSAFHSLHEFAIHCLFCAVIAWLLLRPEAARYFR